MLRHRTIILLLILLLTIGGCTWLDKSEHLRIIGDYEVGWNDLESNRGIVKPNKGCSGCYDVIIESYVYSVGHNDRFIFAKQHPNSDTTTTKYFLIDIDKNRRDAKKGIYGPLDEEEFEKMLTLLGIADIKFDLNFRESAW
jgi:hypothetical protein